MHLKVVELMVFELRETRWSSANRAFARNQRVCGWKKYSCQVSRIPLETPAFQCYLQPTSTNGKQLL